MFARLITKYGLATHLALLASLPLALFPFLAPGDLATVVFWLTGLACVNLLAAPSLRPNEQYMAEARARVRSDIARDPFTWFLAAAVLFAFVRWCNSGVALRFDPEQAQWLVTEPGFAAAPASAGSAGLLPFAVALALAVLLSGIRHGIGLAARVSAGHTASFVAGLGGLAAAGCAAAGVKPFDTAVTGGFADAPFIGGMFGLWLVCSFAFGAQAEARRWGYARLTYCLAVAGNTTGLVLFAPPVVAAVYLLVAVLYALFCLFYLGRAGSMGAVARVAVLGLLGLAAPAFFLFALLPESVRDAKAQGFDFALVFSESFAQMNGALSRIAREMWQKMPWCGVGAGAFELHVPFLAEKAEWAVLPPEPKTALNGYWMLLAERGILGALVPAVGFGMLVWTWVSRLVGAVRFLRGNTDADIFMFACPPVVWCLPFLLALFLGEMAVSPVFSNAPALPALLAPLALSAASFPKQPAAAKDAEKGA